MRFEFIAGNLALDFVATVSERNTIHLERLPSPDGLADWLGEACALDVHDLVTLHDLTAARELRETLFTLVVCLSRHSTIPEGTRAVVNRFAGTEPPLLTLDDSGKPRATGPVSAALSLIARSGIDLAHPELQDMIGWCEGVNCTRPFLDRSRGHRRRWCGMNGCGDRAKAAAYRQRRASALSRSAS